MADKPTENLTGKFPVSPEDFDYDLPPEFIAQTAVEPRDSSRLLVVHARSKRIEHRIFRDLPEYLRPGDVLVLNRTRVIPARLHAIKSETGGAVEILLLRQIDSLRWEALIGGKRCRVGTRLTLLPLDKGLHAQIIAEGEESERTVEFDQPIEAHLDDIGEAPLPPYIHHKIDDPERYQTVYSRTPGSAAAPTAGLHFTPDLLLRIRDMGVHIAYCTLHVGLGTFAPLKDEQIRSRRLHSEYAELLAEDARLINEAKLRGNRVIGVGTTTVRTLETAARRSLESACAVDPSMPDSLAEGDACPWQQVGAFKGTTDLFIMPGFKFRAVDIMVTNFHLPRSSLMMLVSAFAGRETILNAYEIAKQEKYRFFSLGDATLLLP